MKLSRLLFALVLLSRPALAGDVQEVLAGIAAEPFGFDLACSGVDRDVFRAHVEFEVWQSVNANFRMVERIRPLTIRARFTRNAGTVHHYNGSHKFPASVFVPAFERNQSTAAPAIYVRLYAEHTFTWELLSERILPVELLQSLVDTQLPNGSWSPGNRIYFAIPRSKKIDWCSLSVFHVRH